MTIGGAFDEITGFGDGPRPGLDGVCAWLNDTPAEELARRQQSAENTFRQLGITFAVYGDSDAGERIIPFDIVPRVFLADEWARLSRRAGPAGAGDQPVPRRHLR